MKKNAFYRLLPLFALTVLMACSEDGTNFYSDLTDSNSEELYHRLYVQPFLGQWNFYCYDILTQTIFNGPDGKVLDNIQGRDSREISATWTFTGDGWGTIVLKKETILPTTTSNSANTSPTVFDKPNDQREPAHFGMAKKRRMKSNDNLSPLLVFGKEFQWSVDGDSIMNIIFYMDDDVRETYRAEITWENISLYEINHPDTDTENPYWDDNVSLSIHFTRKGGYDSLVSLYSGYPVYGEYNGTGYTYTSDVTLTYHLQRQ